MKTTNIKTSKTMKTTHLKATLFIAVLALFCNVKTAEAQWIRENGNVWTPFDVVTINSDNNPQGTARLNFTWSNYINFTGSYFDFNEDIRVSDGSIKMILEATGTGRVGTRSNHDLHLLTNGTSKVNISKDGSVYIGDVDASIRAGLKAKASLFVSTGILTEDLLIAEKSNWADYVFANDYKLKPLTAVKAFIKENKHLPNIPSQKTISEEGYSSHQMTVRFLEKIEELTLYIIEQEERINVLNKKVDALTATAKATSN